jgi:alpha-L-fucosidase 2
LPALPREWATGKFTGVCTRGAFELNFSWNNTTITEISVLSKAGEWCKISIPEKATIVCNGKKIPYKKTNSNIAIFKTEKNNVYVIK